MIAPLHVEVGKEVTFNGYADDYGRKIDAIQFSLDEGENWTTFDVSESVGELAVQWTFSYTPPKPGLYRLLVRSVNEEGTASPTADVVEFTAR